MSQERWRRVEDLFHAALERPLEARPAFLNAACGEDRELRQEVEFLLSNEEQAGSFLEAPAQPSTLTGTEPLLDVQFGSYRIVSRLGAGGMGEVYRAHDNKLGRDVAIKTLPAEFARNPERLARSRREARTLASLNHPNICTLHDVGSLPSGSSYMVTELVEGETLRDWLKGAPAMERRLEVARQVLEALRAAHGAGIIHRDLKPANIMVRVDGYVKVLDFGLAKRVPSTGELNAQDTVTAGANVPGRIMGTIAYMSPEQILGLEVDARSDLFAFGIILYEMLIGQHPWPRQSMVDMLHAILHDDPAPMQSPFAGIVYRILCKDREERYPSAESVLEALANPAAPLSAKERPKPLASIAVLPFVFLSEVQERRTLSLGFADALITMLGSLRDIAVLPTSAILNYAAGTDPARVCCDLDVRYILQGNVQKVGTQWRVSIHVFDATSQKTTFSEKHDFKLENVFDVQDEIGRRVVESLQSRFPVAVPKSRDRYSSDPAAYDEFIAGLRDSYSDQRTLKESAIQYLSRAVDRDPEFAVAHAALSRASMDLYFEFDPRRTWLEKAEYHCQRSLMLDPELPEGHIARAWILWSPAKNFQHGEAIAALEQALAVQPNLERAHNRMATICWHIGRFEESRLACRQAQRSNPKTRSHNLDYVSIYSGDFERTQQAAEAWLRESPGALNAHIFAAQSALYNGDLDLADRRLAAAILQMPDEPLFVSLQAVLHAWRNRTGPALECVRKALDSPRSFGHTHHTYNQIACVYAVLGDPDKAMGWLERTADSGFPCWPFFQVDPSLETLRGKPEFQKFIADLKRKYTALKIGRL